jgi:hypothetical protein
MDMQNFDAIIREQALHAQRLRRQAERRAQVAELRRAGSGLRALLARALRGMAERLDPAAARRPELA